MFRILAVAIFTTVLFGCDPNHERKCEWYLIPEPKLIGTTDEGKIPVCARNLVVNKQYCRLQADFAWVKKNYGSKFRFVDMDVAKSGRFPRTINNIKFCN